MGSTSLRGDLAWRVAIRVIQKCLEKSGFEDEDDDENEDDSDR